MHLDGGISDRIYKTIEENCCNVVLKTEEVEEPEFKTRLEFDKKHFRDVKKSIEQVGQLQPILVWLDEEGRFFVLDGRYRLRAMKELGIENIEAKLVSGKLGQALAKAMHAQVHKKSLNPLDYAIMAETIKNQTGLSYDEIAKFLGISRRHLIRCREVYMTVYYDIREAVRQGKMSLRRALREIKQRENPESNLYETNKEAWWNEPVQCACCHEQIPRHETVRVCKYCLNNLLNGNGHHEHLDEADDYKDMDEFEVDIGDALMGGFGFENQGLED